jgi:hypothetical protein
MNTPMPRETPSGARLARQVVWPAYRLKAKSGNGARSQARERQFADFVTSCALNEDDSEIGSSPSAFPATLSEGADLGAFLPASHALAADCFDEGVEIIAAIVVRDLVPRLDVLNCADLDHVLDEIDFRVRPAGMIDVTRSVPAARAVDGPTAVDLEHVAIIEVVGGFGTQLPAAVANDELPFLDRDAGEEAEPGF